MMHTHFRHRGARVRILRGGLGQQWTAIADTGTGRTWRTGPGPYPMVRRLILAAVSGGKGGQP